MSISQSKLILNQVGTDSTVNYITLQPSLSGSTTALYVSPQIRFLPNINTCVFGGNIITGNITNTNIITGNTFLATANIGYTTGAGGTVEQTTSRTTGVELNKITGAITLVSDVGSTTANTFTVTNSTVEATDVIILNQKSGTDAYNLQVTNVAAGSFQITFATFSGTTTEQPVFQFAVIKGVNQ